MRRNNEINKYRIHSSRESGSLVEKSVVSINHSDCIKRSPRKRIYLVRTKKENHIEANVQAERILTDSFWQLFAGLPFFHVHRDTRRRP